jgi:hypothetical protein
MFNLKKKKILYRKRVNEVILQNPNHNQSGFSWTHRRIFIELSVILMFMIDVSVNKGINIFREIFECIMSWVLI